MSNPRCNLPEEERPEALKLFGDYPYLHELNEAKQAFRKHIFYETWGRRKFREVFCPDCGRFDIEKEDCDNVYGENFFDFHHGDTVYCPYCGSGPAVLISLGKMRNMSSLRETKKALILRASGSSLTVTAGLFTMEYAFNDLDPYPIWEARKRYLFDGGRRMEWTREEAGHFEKGRWISSGYRWKENRYVSEPFPDGYNWGGSYLDGSYAVVGAGEIGKSPLRYSQIAEFFAGRGADLYDLGEATVRGVIRYLAEYTRRPQMEMLVKLDHSDVVEDLIRGNCHAAALNWRARTPAEFFRLSRAEYREFRAAGGHAEDLEAWKRVMPEAGFAEWRRLYGIFGNHLGQFLEMFGADPRREKIVRWYTQQGSHCPEIWGVWQDLLNLERELGNDVTHDDVLMPEDLRERHDAAAELRNRMEKKTAQQKYGQIFQQLKKRYAYSDGVLSVVVPTCAEEIENEGAALRHCVAGYAERHIRGIKTILFLRWTDDIRTPYVTVEVEPWGTGARILQIHGYRNEGVKGAAAPKEIHEGFLDEWIEWIRQGSPRTNTGKPVRPKMNSEEAIAV